MLETRQKLDQEGITKETFDSLMSDDDMFFFAALVMNVGGKLPMDVREIMLAMMEEEMEMYGMDAEEEEEEMEYDWETFAGRYKGMMKALKEYEDGKPWDWDSPGLIETMNMKMVSVKTLNQSHFFTFIIAQLDPLCIPCQQYENIEKAKNKDKHDDEDKDKDKVKEQQKGSDLLVKPTVVQSANND